jgi:hypothetical protein
MNFAFFCHGIRLCLHHEAVQISKLRVGISYRAIPFVPYIVDSYPNCCCGFVHESGQKDLAPGLLPEYRPDLHLVVSVTWEREVRKQGEEMGIRGAFLIAS